MGYRSAARAGFDPRKVPTQRVVLDRTHPLAQGMIGAFIATQGTRDLCGNSPPLATLSGGAPVLIMTASGPAWRQATGDDALYAPAAAAFTTGQTFGAFWSGVILGTKVGAFDSLAAGVDYSGAAESPPYISYGLDSTDNFTARSPASSGPAFSTTIGQDLSAAALLGEFNAVYQNGTPTGYSVGTNTAPIIFTAASTLTVGGYRGDTGRSPNIGTRCAYFYNQIFGSNNGQSGLSPMQWLAAEPFAMFRPVVLRRYYAAAAVSGAISGTAAATSTATGTLTGRGALTGTAAAASTATATLRGLAPLTGTAAAAATATATLTGRGAVSGTAAAASTATGTLSGRGALTGTGAAASTATGTLAGAGALAGTAAVASTATGTLASPGSGAISGTATAAATASGTLTGRGSLTGTAVAAAAATGTLIGFGPITGTAAIVSTATGTLTAAVAGSAIFGTADAVSTATGALTGLGALMGTAAGRARATLKLPYVAKPASSLVPGVLVRPPLNDPPMRADQFSQAWNQFFQQVADQVSASTQVTNSAVGLATAPSYANDAAAAAGGVAVGGFYRNGSAVHVRLV